MGCDVAHRTIRDDTHVRSYCRACELFEYPFSSNQVFQERGFGT